MPDPEQYPEHGPDFIPQSIIDALATGNQSFLELALENKLEGIRAEIGLAIQKCLPVEKPLRWLIFEDIDNSLIPGKDLLVMYYGLNGTTANTAANIRLIACQGGRSDVGAFSTIEQIHLYRTSHVTRSIGVFEKRHDGRAERQSRATVFRYSDEGLLLYNLQDTQPSLGIMEDAAVFYQGEGRDVEDRFYSVEQAELLVRQIRGQAPMHFGSRVIEV